MNAVHGAAPVGGQERLHLIDALRGFALAGVLLANLVSFSLYGYLDEAQRAALPTASLDQVLWVLRRALVNDKAITIFSMLFGLGFALQLERARQRGVDGLRVYVRRIAILLAIGAIHAYLVWWGDILLIYAGLALLMIPFRHASNRTLLWTGLLVALFAEPLLAPLMEIVIADWPSEEQMDVANLAAFSSPSYVTALRQNIVFANWTWLGWWDYIPFVFGRFLLGYWAGRMYLLQDPVRNRALITRLFFAGLAIGVLGTLFGLGLAQDSLQLEARLPWLGTNIGDFLTTPLRLAGPLGLGIAYAMGFTLLFLVPRWQAWLNVLAPVGRMALTNYLTQSVVCITLFYGIGFGVGPRHGLALQSLVWALLFLAQVALSHWWLARFRFGPMEWLWRTLTYGSLQPMRGGHA